MRTRTLGAMGAVATALGLSCGAMAADVGVSIQFSQPGVYGRVDIGQYPQPELILSTPTIIERAPPGAPPPEPVYLYVPPEHRAHWREHCHEYHACGRPVYFVDHNWYQRTVVARDQERRRDRGRPEEAHERHRDHEERGDRGEEDRGRDHSHD